MSVVAGAEVDSDVVGEEALEPVEDHVNSAAPIRSEIPISETGPNTERAKAAET